MSKSTAARDQEQRMMRVLDYIFAHPDEDLSRQALGQVAHYSPEHLPKLFKQFTGETPKQYSVRLRLEKAFHLLVIHPYRSVAAIGLDCGFTSLSVFSRAMKTYFHYSPEEIRRLPHGGQMRLLHGSTAVAPVSAAAVVSASAPLSAAGKPAAPPEVCIVRRPSIRGIYVPAPFNAPERITEAFKALSRFSGEALSGFSGDRQVLFFGILTPHLRNTYRAFLMLSPDRVSGLPYPTTKIEGGAYACFTVAGDLRTTNKAAHYFYRRWLPGSGYRISGIAGFETFDRSPAGFPYLELRRHIHVPIEPLR